MKQSINMLSRGNTALVLTCMSHDELVPASTDARALYRERGWFYFLYKVSVKSKLYKMTDIFTNHFAYVILEVSN
jgi:hypothetical protein